MKDKRFLFFPKYSDKLLIFATLATVVYGSLMIMSAKMSEKIGETSQITETLGAQLFFIFIGLVAMIMFANIPIRRLKYGFVVAGFFVILFSLLITRAFGQTNGAYAWIKFGSHSIQPSEFAKLFIIFFGARNLGIDHKENNLKFLKRYWLHAGIIFLIIALYQNDFGTAIVFLLISLVVSLIPSYKEYERYRYICVIIILIVFILAVFCLTPFGTNFIATYAPEYIANRFIASANPFDDQYDSGYNLVMSLVSFAKGGLRGRGYSDSIYKYMNFPNPSNDFILPIIVEEMGIIGGLLIILVLYGLIVFKLIRYSLRMKDVGGKIVLAGTYTYIIVHFILNVGGVSGLIPLTGVPLLLISDGGSSLVATMSCLGVSESVIDAYRKEKVNADNSR